MTRRSAFTLVAALSLGACAASSAPTPTRPLIEVDTTKCVAGVETVFSIDDDLHRPKLEGLAVGPDGTAYFAQCCGEAEAGIYAVSSGSLARFVAPVLVWKKLWVDGSSIFAQTLDGLVELSMPRSTLFA